MRAPTAFVLIASLCFAGPSFADGAFPDELSVYLPGNAPNRIMLGATFGLVITEDSGANWRFVCEYFITRNQSDIVNFYKLGSDGAVLAISLVHLWRTTDGGCTWTQASGSVSSLAVTDAFIDPNDPTFVVAIGSNATGSGLYPSHDGGLTFGPAIYGPTPSLLVSIEIASTQGTIYATQVDASNNSYLLKTADSGGHWTRQQLPVSTGTQPRIMAIDPADANKVYLRLFNFGASTDEVAITTNGGLTLTTPIALSGTTTYLSSFLRAADSSVYVGTTNGDLYVEAPGATTFTRRSGPLTRCLGQRPGSSRIYACGDGSVDGYNLGYSDDGATTFQPLMSFRQIAGPLTCPAVNDTCASWYALLLQTLGSGPDGGTPGGTTNRSGSSHCGGVGIGGALASVLARVFRRRSRHHPSGARKRRQA